MGTLPKLDENFSQYTRHLSTMTSACALTAGFIFTVITLLLTQLSYSLLASVVAQIILFILYTLFLLLIFTIIHLIMMSHFLMKVIPPRSKQITFTNIIWGISMGTTGFLPILLFILWNFVYLVLLGTSIWLVFFVLAIFMFVIPMLKRPR